MYMALYCGTLKFTRTDALIRHLRVVHRVGVQSPLKLSNRVAATYEQHLPNGIVSSGLATATCKCLDVFERTI